MLLVAEKGREDEVLRVFEKWGLDAVIVGHVTAEPRMRILHHGEAGCRYSQCRRSPMMRRSITAPWNGGRLRCRARCPRAVSRARASDRDFTADLKRLLASPKSAPSAGCTSSTTPWCRPIPWMGPGGEAGVMRIKGAPQPRTGHGAGRQRALVLSRSQAGSDACRRRSGAQGGLTGATPVAATNCLNFGNPEKPEIMAQLSAGDRRHRRGLHGLETPITGGNVSFYNETRGEGIYPTPCWASLASSTTSRPLRHAVRQVRPGGDAPARLRARRSYRCGRRVWLLRVRP